MDKGIRHSQIRLDARKQNLKQNAAGNFAAALDWVLAPELALRTGAVPPAYILHSALSPLPTPRPPPLFWEIELGIVI